MKRLMASLHVTRWLRVVAVAGVVFASAASVDKEGTEDAAPSYSAARTSNYWCPRC